jgi:hypothetical protein
MLVYITKFQNSFFTTRKLANTNRNTNKKISLVYDDDLYRQNFSSMNPSVYIDRKFYSVYIDRMIEDITMGFKKTNLMVT